MSEPSWQFYELVRELNGPRDEAARVDLHTLFLKNVSWTAGRYPEAWFDGFQKGPPAYERLSRVLQGTSESVRFPWFPFIKRRPYETWVAERSPDKTVRWFTFRSREYALLKLQLWKDYRDNCRLYPPLQARAALWKRVGAILDVYAERVGETSGGTWLYRLRADRPAASAPLARDLERTLVEHGAASRAVLVDALRTHLTLVEGPSDDMRVRDAVTEAAVRRVVKEVWERLEPHQKAIMAAAAEGKRSVDMFHLHPTLANEPAVTRAITDIDDRFLRALRAELGEGPRSTAASGIKPRALCRLIHAVVVDLAKAGGTWRDAGRARVPTLPGAPPPDPDGWEAFRRLWDALRDAGRAERAGLADSFVAGVAQEAWEADPASGLAEAEIAEGWVEDGEDAEREAPGG